jgi:hypothetical protein
MNPGNHVVEVIHSPVDRVGCAGDRSACRRGHYRGRGYRCAYTRYSPLPLSPEGARSISNPSNRGLPWRLT